MLLFLKLRPEPGVFHSGWLDAGTLPKSPYGSTVPRLFHFCENLFRKKHRDIRTANQYGFPSVDIPVTFEDARLLLSIRREYFVHPGELPLPKR